MKIVKQKQPIDEVSEKLKEHPLVYLRNKLLERERKVKRLTKESL